VTAQIEAPWAKIPKALLRDEKITGADLRTYWAIDYLAGKRGWWYGSQEMLAEEAGISPRTLERSCQRLKARGYISTRRLGMKYHTWTMYHVLARTVAAPAEPDERPRSRAGSDPAAERAPIPQTSATDLTDDDPRENYAALLRQTGGESGVRQPALYWSRPVTVPAWDNAALLPLIAEAERCRHQGAWEGRDRGPLVIPSPPWLHQLMRLAPLAQRGVDFYELTADLEQLHSWEVRTVIGERMQSVLQLWADHADELLQLERDRRRAA
jgi:hypothetical protein